MTTYETYDGIGPRVAELRKLAGLTQKALSLRCTEVGAPVSHGLIRGVERGAVTATAAFVSSVAKALRVSSTELTGQPYRSMPDDREIHGPISAIRTELAAYDLDNLDIREVRPFEALTPEVAQVREYRRAASFQKLGDSLPWLLREVRAAVHRSTGADREQALMLLCELYYGSHSLAHKLGYPDLAAQAIDRLSWAATESGDPLWIATGQFHRAAILTSAGNWSAALQFLERCRGAIEPRLGAGGRADLIAWGGLHLQSGLAAARSGKKDLADSHLAEARETAIRIGDDKDRILSFGPTNVGIWSVALAVEAMDGAEALSRAALLQIPTGTPKERAGHHWIDVARAHLLHGDRGGAFDSLLTAREIAPAQTRYNPMVHETLRALSRAEARKAGTLHEFAAWCRLTRI